MEDTNTKALNTWPERIYLQHSHDGYPVPTYKVDTDEISWCEDRQFDCDVEYVRADLVALSQPPAPQPVICEDCGDACMAHNPGVCGNCYAMQYRDAQPPAVQVPPG